MATYLNAFEILKQVRMSLNEYDVIDENYLEGVDTSGAYQNTYIMQQINNAQRYIYNTLMISTYNRNSFWIQPSCIVNSYNIITNTR